MRLFFLLVLSSCGPATELEPALVAEVGKPCPGPGRAACDAAKRYVAHCRESGGVWEFAHAGCPEGLGLSGGP